MILQHAFGHEIRPDKHMPMHALTLLAIKCRHRHLLLHHRHMALLAGLRRRIFAMLPLLTGYLLRNPPCRRPVGTQGLGNQRMPAATESGVTYMICLGRNVARRGGVHDRLMPFVDFKRAILRPPVSLNWLSDRYIPDERSVGP